MSETVAVADPAPFDAEEVVKFKARFGAARGKEIETANAAAMLGVQKLNKLRKTKALDEEAATIAKKNWSDKKNFRERKKNNGETPPEKVLREISENADSKLALSSAAVTTAEEELATTVKTLEKSPREGYGAKVMQLNTRLSGPSTKKNDTSALLKLDATILSDIGAALRRRDYDGADARLRQAEDKVLAAVADKEMADVHGKLASRVDTLLKSGLGEKGEAKAIGDGLAAVDLAAPTGAGLAKLEREIEPVLKKLEDRVQAFLDLFNVLKGEIEDLERRDAEAANPHRVELTKCGNIAKGKLEDAQIRLNALQNGVVATNTALRDKAAALAAYPLELASVQQRIKGFPAISASHKTFNGQIGPKGVVGNKLKQAATAAATGDFALACIYLNDVDDLLTDFDEQATLKETATASKQAKDKLDADKAAAALAQQQAMQLAAQQAAQALQAQIDAMVPSSLDVIGKAASFENWMDKLHALLQTDPPAVVGISVGQPYWLNGNTTVEIEVDVTGVEFADFFVVHYHPYPYVNPYTGVTEQPKMHGKPYCGNATTPHDYRVSGSSHWLFGRGLPNLAAIIDAFA